MKDLAAKAKVILTALPTYLTTAAVIVTVFAEEIAKAFPDKAVTVVHVLLIVLADLSAAVAIIRRVTPVLEHQIGLLPQAPPPVAELDKKVAVAPIVDPTK